MLEQAPRGERKGESVATCQIGACSNHGIHGCTTCGKLFCAKDGRLINRMDLTFRCADCQRQLDLENQKEAEQGLKVAKVGCIISALGMAMAIIAGASGSGAVAGACSLIIIFGIILAFAST